MYNLGMEKDPFDYSMNMGSMDDLSDMLGQQRLPGPGSDNQGGFGSITKGGSPSEPEKKTWMDHLYSLMGGDPSGYATSHSQPSESQAMGIPGLLAMGNYRAKGRKPRERMDALNNQYVQSLMGG